MTGRRDICFGLVLSLTGAAVSWGCGEGGGDAKDPSMGGLHEAGGTTTIGAGGGGGAGVAGVDPSNGGGMTSDGRDGGPLPEGSAFADSSGLSDLETLRCAPQFPYQDDPNLGTWLGGDSAYSVSLSSTAAVWTFQDTFVGPQHQTGRAGVPIIGDTLAIAECHGGVFSLHYFWTRSGPKAFFDGGNAQGSRFWTLQPWMHQGTLFAAQTEVRNAAAGFDELSTKLARVANPLDPPGSWHVEYSGLANIPGLGKGAVVQERYVYLYGPFENDQIVARLPLDELVKPAADPPALLQYLSKAGDWKAGLSAADAKKMGLAANTGISLRYVPGLSQWVALFMNTSTWPSANVAVSSAASLEGPWSKPANVYSVEEMNPSVPGYDSDTICYAAIEHPEWNPNTEGQLLFTYTCNSTVFAKQVANMSIYVPRVVSIKNPLVK